MRRGDLQDQGRHVGKGVMGARQAVDHRHLADPVARLVEIQHRLLPIGGGVAQADDSIDDDVHAVGQRATTKQTTPHGQVAQVGSRQQLIAVALRQAGDPRIAHEYIELLFREF
ncbi:hypothetical protein FQZ97_1053300 [compost metagenome]